MKNILGINYQTEAICQPHKNPNRGKNSQFEERGRYIKNDYFCRMVHQKDY
jgi:hypothetical protein